MVFLAEILIKLITRVSSPLYGYAYVLTWNCFGWNSYYTHCKSKVSLGAYPVWDLICFTKSHSHLSLKQWNSYYKDCKIEVSILYGFEYVLKGGIFVWNPYSTDYNSKVSLLYGYAAYLQCLRWLVIYILVILGIFYSFGTLHWLQEVFWSYLGL